MDSGADESRLDNLGISRRDLLQRGAVVSGSLLLAGPAIQSLSRPAFADTGTPADGPAISYVAVAIHCQEGLTSHIVRAKWEEGSSHPGGWEPDPGPPTAGTGGDCYPADYHDGDAVDGNEIGLVFQLDASGTSGTLHVPSSIPHPDSGDDCVVLKVSVAVFGGQACAIVEDQVCLGGCSIPVAL